MCGYDLHVVCFARKLKCFKFCFISMYQNGRKQVKKNNVLISFFGLRTFLDKQQLCLSLCKVKVLVINR